MKFFNVSSSCLEGTDRFESTELLYKPSGFYCGFSRFLQGNLRSISNLFYYSFIMYYLQLIIHQQSFSLTLNIVTYRNFFNLSIYFFLISSDCIHDSVFLRPGFLYSTDALNTYPFTSVSSFILIFTHTILLLVLHYTFSLSFSTQNDCLITPPCSFQ